MPARSLPLRLSSASTALQAINMRIIKYSLIREKCPKPNCHTSGRCCCVQHRASVVGCCPSRSCTVPAAHSAQVGALSPPPAAVSSPPSLQRQIGLDHLMHCPACAHDTMQRVPSWVSTWVALSASDMPARRLSACCSASLHSLRNKCAARWFTSAHCRSNCIRGDKSNNEQQFIVTCQHQHYTSSTVTCLAAHNRTHTHLLEGDLVHFQDFLSRSQVQRAHYCATSAIRETQL